MSGRKSSHRALANATAFGLAALGAVAARGQTVTNITSSAGSTTGNIIEGTVYEYANGTVPNTCCHGAGGSGTTTEIPRQSSFGPGTLNDQLYGSQSDLDNNLYRGGVGAYAYQAKGIPDPNNITETDPVYFSAGVATMQFNLPSSITADLVSDIVIETSSNPAISFNQTPSVAITDQGGNTINYTGFSQFGDGPTGHGIYETDIIPLAGTNFAGSSVTFSFPGNGNQWGAVDEIDFYTTAPQPNQWNTNGSGDWNQKANWTFSAPNGIGAQAELLGIITSNNTVYTNTPVTVGTLIFNNANSYVVAGAGSLTMQTSSGNATISVQTGNDSITLPLILASNTTINAAAGTSLNIANSLTVNPNVTVSQTGSGSVIYSNIVTLLSGASVSFGNDTANSLNIGGSAVASVSGSGSVLNVYNLGISAGGKLDVAKGTVNVNYGGGNPNGGGPDPIATLRSEIASAYTGGTWAGAGITTSSGDAHHGIGYVDNGSTVEMKYTLYGDTNLDGVINFSDLLTLAQNYNSTHATWATGDFNYDSTVNFADLLALAQNYNAVLGPNSGLSPSFVSDWNLAQSEVAAVPEPASIGLLALGAIGLFGRRRRSA